MALRSSNWISLVLICFIPMAWLVQYVINMLTLKKVMGIIKETGESIRDYEFLFIDIPIGQLVTLCTIVIPAIFVRKLVREGTANINMPIGKNGKNDK